MADAKNTMWCQECRQDVPALPSGDLQTLCCARCGTAICADPTPTDGSAATRDQLPGYDSWTLDEQLRHIQRVLQKSAVVADGAAVGGDSSRRWRGETAELRRLESPPTRERDVVRFDPPQAALPAQHVATKRLGKPLKTVGNRGTISSFVTWCVLTLGATGFACGGILLGWSLSTGRPELWTVGLPMALAGQIALLVGLVLQIDRLWHDNREAAAKLDNVDEQLHELKTTTTLLSTSQSPAATTFYSHLAGGAGPQLLLADLKSQLDLLAMKLAEDE